jgi:alpha-galactosidase
MAKITLIGAGSVVFTRNLCSDMLLSPALQAARLTLMDIDPVRLAQARDMVQVIVDRRGLKAQVEATTDRREAVRGAGYVITAFQQGGLKAYQMDIEVPQRYGVEQCIGDTLGPGGIFRALRTIPVLIDLCQELNDVAPDALLLNYVNPMAANTWAVYQATGRPCVGLCHSVPKTAQMLANWISVAPDEVTYLCAGINHFAFFLQFRRGKQDLYPLIREAIQRPEVYGQEPVRIELMKAFGYFVTEASAHASDYVPYFRKTAGMVNEDLVPRFKHQANYWCDFGRTGGYLRYCIQRLAQTGEGHEALMAGRSSLPTERTCEPGSYIIEAMETNQPVRINSNVPNWGLIANLPQGCCVEVPCLIDGNGVQPIAVGALPVQLAALMRTNVNVQELIVEAALTGNTDAIYHAALLDPLTAAVCTMPQIRSIVDDMLSAQAEWLPQFRRERPGY